MKRPLYPYQREGVERFLAAGRLLLADDMGLGKTAQAITCCDILKRTGRIRRGLIIAPASLKPQWAREWAGVLRPARSRSSTALPTNARPPTPSARKGSSSSIMSNCSATSRSSGDWDPDLVVLDEAQRIKNWATKTALSVKGLAPPYRLVLDRHADGKPDRRAGLDRRVGRRHGARAQVAAELAARDRGPTAAARSSAPATSTRSATGCGTAWCAAIRQDVLDQLPSRTDTRVPIEMTEEQMDEHDALIQPIVAARADGRSSGR